MSRTSKRFQVISYEKSFDKIYFVLMQYLFFIVQFYYVKKLVKYYLYNDVFCNLQLLIYKLLFYFHRYLRFFKIFHL